MRALVSTLISNHYKTLAKSLNFLDWSGADEEKKTISKKKKKKKSWKP